MSEGNGTRVTAESLDGGEGTVTRVIKDDYSLVTDGDCYVAGIQVYPGTHVITVRNVGGKRRTGAEPPSLHVRKIRSELVE